MSDLLEKTLNNSKMKGPELLELLRASKSFEEQLPNDERTKSYWFKVFNSECMINPYLIFKNNLTEMYRVNYHSKNPIELGAYINTVISFEEFFESIPDDAKEEVLFQLDLFR